VWRLSNARDDKGQLDLLTNELNDHDRNLSFEREFGKIIGSLDLFAITLSEKYQRGITRVMQTLSTALLLPFGL
jgi:Cdc6-like AAA superfamily ATPase